MSSLTNFLSGNVVPPQPTGSDSTTQMPAWLQSLTYNLGNTAFNLAGQPYNPFPGPTVATPSTDTNAAWQMAQTNAGRWQMPYGAAGALTSAGSTPIDPSEFANYAGDMANTVGGTGGQLTGALNASSLGALPGYTGAINSSTLGSAGAYQGALNSAAAQGEQQLQNPYNSQVVGATEQALNQNLFQNTLPAIQDRFVSAGQSASPQEMEMTNQAIQRNQQTIGQAIAPELQQGYTGALNVANQNANAGLNAASGATGSALNAATGASNTGFGLANSGYQGALNTGLQEQGYQLAGGAQYGQLAGELSQLGASDVSQLSAAGNQQDNYNQANINAALNQFNAQNNYGWNQLGQASNIVRGVPYGTTTQTAGLTGGGGYTASPLSTGIGVGALAGALSWRKGGSVSRRPVRRARGGALELARAA